MSGSGCSVEGICLLLLHLFHILTLSTYVNVEKASQVSFYMHAQQFACITHQELVAVFDKNYLRSSQGNVPAGLACHMTYVQWKILEHKGI